MEQRSQEWFDARKGKITGSRVGKLLGVNQYQSADDLMREMVREHFGAESEFTGNEATDHGTLMEPYALASYRRRSGYDVREEGLILHPEHDCIGVSPDGLIGDDGGIEIKCPFYYKRPYSVFDAKKASYYAQCQLVIQVCGLRWLDFYCYIEKDGEVRDLIERVEPDADWWALALPRILAFHAEFQRTIEDPDLFMRHLRKKGQDAEEIADDRMAELAALHRTIADSKACVALAVKRYDELKRELGTEFGGSVQGNGVLLKVTKKQGQIDHKAVYAKFGIADVELDAHRKPGTVAFEVVPL